ncbi:DUF1656 domain-containing protein [Acinetobacter pittii]|uniref:DUF1656 domain-containing protein n=1 Tax=Acinetobacter pittii TaxID=48296 RepID=UPI002271DC8D|nr:DUF1656 domain-containing protein [Acinetobacter pittii]
MGEFNVYGIYVPSLLVQALLAYICFRGLSPLTNKLIAQGWIALPSIFNLCFGGVSKSMLKKSRLNFDKIEKCK